MAGAGHSGWDHLRALIPFKPEMGSEAPLQRIGVRVLIVLITAGLCLTAVEAQTSRWSEQKANSWYAEQPWLVGSNYTPRSAINQLEMWQEATFNPAEIDEEFTWAESMGMNTMRVFLHDLLWQQDAAGFQKRIDTFLSIASKHHIKILFVLFDSCWDPNPQLGPQRAPRPGVHNSGWVQSPGAKALEDPSQYPRLEAYVKGVVGAFAKDSRVLGWDVWNEPDNSNDGNYPDPANKVEIVAKLLPQVFDWARSAHPTQPLTSGLWKGEWAPLEKLDGVPREQVELSDIISFHNYDKPESFESRVTSLLPYHRPLICTEYMARGNGSTFQGTLPIAKKYNVAAINWGLVEGKTQTTLPWDSWQHPYTDRQPAIWFHDVFRTNGTPYSTDEVNFIRTITGRGTSQSARR